MDELLRKEYYDKAFKLHSNNYVNEAENFYKKIISEDSNDSEILNLIGICELQQGNFDEAEKYTSNAIIISPKRYYYQTLSNIYSTQKNYNKELETRLTEQELFGLNYELAFNLGLLYKSLSDFENSEKYYLLAIELNNGARDAYFNLANLYKSYRYFEKANEYYQKCLTLNSNDREARYCLSLSQMITKDYKNGLKNFESRLCRESAIETERKTYPNLVNEANIWHGENIKDKVLYTYYEAGFGDMIMFARYIPILEKLCKKLIIKPQIELYQLFKENFPNCEIMKYFYDEKDLKFDYHIPFLSVPYTLELNSESMFPYSNKYMTANKEKAEEFKKLYFNNNKFKIGIKWQGNTYYDTDRVINIDAFSKLFELPKAQIYSCQTFEGTEELEKIKDKNIIDISQSLEDFSYTAAAVENLDLIICNDTSLVHLAGAMGKPCIVLLPYDYNWRWHTDISKCNWYDSVKIYSAKKGESWNSVLDRVIKEIKL